MVADFWQDLRYGARMLVKNSAFSLIAIILLRHDGDHRHLIEALRPAILALDHDLLMVQGPLEGGSI